MIFLKRYNNRALSLLEIMITLVIITVALVGIGSIFSVGMNAVNKNKVKLTARNLAKDLMEEVLSKAHWKTDGDACGGGGALAPETGEIRWVGMGSPTFNDVDDYNNFVDNPITDIKKNPLPYPGFRRSVIVKFLNPVDLSDSQSPTSFKKVTVIVDYDPQGNFSPSVFTYSISQIITYT